MLPIGTPAPPFSLPDTEGHQVSLEDFHGHAGLIVAFISNHCPFVIHLKDALTSFAQDYEGRIPLVAIASNDVGSHPQDGPEHMAEDKRIHGYPFPYLFDETQAVAKAYEAACTPDFYLFDGDFKLVYRGQFDSSRPGNNVAVTGDDLRRATDALLSGAVIPEDQHTPSLGCNIKWKPGQEPDYFSRG